jgi:hypothetical protein
MKSLRDIREQARTCFNEEKDKLSSLVHAGILKENKLSTLKRAMENSNRVLTPSEQGTVMNVLESLIIENAVNVEEELQKAPTKMTDMPTVLMLKRKAVRVYPGGQNVGLYYSQQLDKYVAVPFTPGETAKADKKSVLTMSEAKKDDDDTNPMPFPVRRPRKAKAKDKRKPDQKNVFGDTADDFAKGGISRLISRAFLNLGRKHRVAGLIKARNQKRATTVSEENLEEGLVAGVAARVATGIGAKLLSKVAPKTAGKLATKNKKLSSKYSRKTLDRYARIRKIRNRKNRRDNDVDVDISSSGSRRGSASSSGSQRPQFKPVPIGGQSTLEVRPNDAFGQARSRAQDLLYSKQVQETVELDLNGNKFELNKSVAAKVQNVYESLNKTNRKKMLRMMNESTESFNKIISFAVGQ